MNKEQKRYLKEIKAQSEGTIISIDSKKIGEALVCLGGGRTKKDEEIDYAVGFEFKKKVGDKVNVGDTILTCLYNDKERFNESFEYISDAIIVKDVNEEIRNSLKAKPNILDII